MDTKTVLDKAKAAVDPPTQTELARRLGISQPSVSEWIARGRIPVERCPDIERVTGIPRSELRPDIFGDLEQTAA